MEGHRNPNNPKNILSKCQEVIIAKRPNYMDCVSFGCCISENVFKVYTTENYERIHGAPTIKTNP